MKHWQANKVAIKNNVDLAEPPEYSAFWLQSTTCKKKSGNAMKRLITVVLVALTCTVSVPSQAQQILKVGIQENVAPLNFIDLKSNTAQGLCVDVITEIAKDEDFKVQFVPMAFSFLLSALTSSKIDIISSNMSPTL